MIEINSDFKKHILIDNMKIPIVRAELEMDIYREREREIERERERERESMETRKVHEGSDDMLCTRVANKS